MGTYRKREEPIGGDVCSEGASEIGNGFCYRVGQYTTDQFETLEECVGGGDVVVLGDNQYNAVSEYSEGDLSTHGAKFGIAYSSVCAIIQLTVKAVSYDLTVGYEGVTVDSDGFTVEYMMGEEREEDDDTIETHEVYLGEEAYTVIGDPTISKGGTIDVVMDTITDGGEFKYYIVVSVEFREVVVSVDPGFSRINEKSMFSITSQDSLIETDVVESTECATSEDVLDIACYDSAVVPAAGFSLDALQTDGATFNVLLGRSCDIRSVEISAKYPECSPGFYWDTSEEICLSVEEFPAEYVPPAPPETEPVDPAASTFGLRVHNHQNQVLVSSDLENMHYGGEATFIHIKSRYEDHGGNVIYTFRFYTESMPLAFIKPADINLFYSVLTHHRYDTYWEFDVIQSGLSEAPPRLLIFVSPSGLPAPSDSYGFQVLMADGKTAFDSRMKPLSIIGGGSCKPPGYAPNDGPTPDGEKQTAWNYNILDWDMNSDKTFTEYPVASEVDVTDLIFCAPSLCQSVWLRRYYGYKCSDKYPSGCQAHHSWVSWGVLYRNSFRVRQGKFDAGWTPLFGNYFFSSKHDSGGWFGGGGGSSSSGEPVPYSQKTINHVDSAFIISDSRIYL